MRQRLFLQSSELSVTNGREEAAAGIVRTAKTAIYVHQKISENNKKSRNFRFRDFFGILQFVSREKGGFCSKSALNSEQALSVFREDILTLSVGVERVQKQFAKIYRR